MGFLTFHTPIKQSTINAVKGVTSSREMIFQMYVPNGNKISAIAGWATKNGFFILFALIENVLISWGNHAVAETKNLPYDSSHQSKNAEVRFFALITGFTESGQFTVKYSGKRTTNPSIKTFRFWGLKITDQRALESFWVGRVGSCVLVPTFHEIASVDCLAAPGIGARFLLSGNTDDWLDVFRWSSEFGWAKRECIDEEKEPVYPSASGSRSHICTPASVSVRRAKIVQ